MFKSSCIADVVERVSYAGWVGEVFFGEGFALECDNELVPLWGVFVAKEKEVVCSFRGVWLVFNWLLAPSGLSTLFTWGTCHIRFRKAWKVQGHSIEELPFHAMFGV